MSSTTITEATDLHPAWGARFNAGDVEGMLALAETGSAFAPAPGALVTGEDYRAALTGFLALGLPIDLALRRSLVVGDLALLVYDWTIQGTATDGQTVSLAGTTADIARRGAHGWRFVLDNPFGTA